MENLFNIPKQIVKANLEAGEAKTKLPILKLLVLGVMAGAAIAFGGSSSNVAVHAVENAGLAKFAAGAIFPVGLMIIVLIGGELFTGDCLIINGVLQKRCSVLAMIKTLCLVWISNFVGALLIVGLIHLSGQYDMSQGLLGAYTIKVALGKVNLSVSECISSGILCNILVCIAVLMAGSARDVNGKIWAIFFPILAFVLGSYEHCVANMYYIPAGIVAAKNPMYIAKAIEVYGYTAEQMEALNVSNMFAHNLLPVTLGNIIGGMVFVALPLYYLHLRKTK